MSKKSRIVKVELFTQDGSKEYYFGCLRAIFTELTEEQVGCKLPSLYSSGLSKGKPYANSKCVIRYFELARSPQKG